MSAGWADSLAAGLGAAIAGEDLDDVVGAVVESALLNLIPLYAIGSVVYALSGPIKELLGVEKDPPLLGLILDADALEPRGPGGAFYRVAHAAILRTAGFERYQDVTPTSGPGALFGSSTLTLHKVHFDKWSWLIDLQDRIVDAYRAGGAEGIKQLLQTSALHVQAFHAAVALQAWAEGTAEIPGDPPEWRYATKPYLELAVRAARFPFEPDWFVGAEKKQLKGKWGLFKRLGLPSYQQYEAAILANAGPQYAPVDEVFPGAAAMNVEPIEGFEDQVPTGETAPEGGEGQGGTPRASALPLSLAGPSASKPKAQSKAAPKSPELPVAIGIGGLAILLALL